MGRTRLILGLTAFLVSNLIGIPLGMLAAAKRNSPLDQAITAVSVLGMGIPNFWLALLLIYFLQ